MSQRRTLVLLMILLLASGSLGAQKAPKISTANAKSLKCAFGLQAAGTWNGETPLAEVKEARVTLGFDAIDAQGGTADATGGSGAPHVVVRLSGGTLHFLQISNSGPLYVTTVFDHLTPGGRLKAVHTRHEYTSVSLPGFTSRPEQYYGSCEVTVN